MKIMKVISWVGISIIIGLMIAGIVSQYFS